MPHLVDSGCQELLVVNDLVVINVHTVEQRLRTQQHHLLDAYAERAVSDAAYIALHPRPTDKGRHSVCVSCKAT